MKILSLCDYTGNMLKPWAEAGHDCVAVDLAQDNPRFENGINYIKADIFKLEISANTYDFVFAFPPCTDLAASGARWWQDKGIKATIESLQLVEQSLKLCQTARRGWMIENPIGRLANLWRKPDHYFDPCDYGDPYTKKTCLWVGGDFRIPAATPVEPVKACAQGSFLQKLGGKSEKTKRIRSTTPMGFARAVYTANS